MRAKLLLLGFSLIISCCTCEIAARLLYHPAPTYKDYIRDLRNRPERLFYADTHVIYDISGLYKGAAEVELNVSSNRLIEPDPTGDNETFHVLFLGGSTTETLYVPEEARWVALINNHPEIAAYNGGQSGKTILDNLQTFHYLTQNGYKFDLVVLMTAINDMNWIHWLNQLGYSFTQDQYYDGMQVYFSNTGQESLWKNAAETSQLLTLIDVILHPEITAVVERYRLERREGLKKIEACSQYAHDLETFEGVMGVHLQELYEAVDATGAKLLILSEPTSHNAPTESFFEDLRYISNCDNGDDYFQAQLSLRGHANELYLQLGTAVGALTYNYATSMEHYSNGKQGGLYMYDTVHYTPLGSQQAAEILLPVILNILQNPTGTEE